ncbi:hypothetical protein [Streptomyces coeruleorubidus]|uniref:hypothetical protein n=1 Tax=Streptomyces coeruleorubidus TaxID=116188 RepID=UPI0036C0439B
MDTTRPQAGELLVRVAAATLNGIDIATAAAPGLRVGEGAQVVVGGGPHTTKPT